MSRIAARESAAVDQGDAGDDFGRLQCGLRRNAAAHAVAGDYRRVDVERMQQGRDVAGHRRHVESTVEVHGSAVSAQIHRQYLPVEAREVADLRVPVAGVAGHAMDQDDGRLTARVQGVMNQGRVHGFSRRVDSAGSRGRVGRYPSRLQAGRRYDRKGRKSS